MAERYVIDASILIQRFLVETYTPNVQALTARLYEGDELFIPEFCLIECTNVFWTCVRFRGMPQADAEQFTDELSLLPLQIMPIAGLLLPALKIGLNYQLAIYDSLYIALAQDLACPLITMDARQSEAAVASGIALKLITDF